MTDLEIVTACAKAMEYVPELNETGTAVYCNRHTGIGFQGKPIRYGGFRYNPLTDDAQNAALDDVLLKHGWYEMWREGFSFSCAESCFNYQLDADMTVVANRLRARCECVAILVEGV